MFARFSLTIAGLCMLLADTSFASKITREAGMTFTDQELMQVIGQLQATYGASEKSRIIQGVDQSAKLWRKEDGTLLDYTRFCLRFFTPAEKLPQLLARFEEKMEKLTGHFNALQLALRRQLDENRTTLQPVDSLFAQYNPSSHLSEDLFRNKLAFVVLLNFPARTLEELIEKSDRLSRKDWAAARLAKSFLNRIPSEVRQVISKRESEADQYIQDYNIYLDHVLGPDSKPMFRKGLRLISHWGLRDELKALYSNPIKNLAKQKMIYTIMERIITQTIPQAVINKPVEWDPVANTVAGKSAPAEKNTRYFYLLQLFQAQRLKDPFFPDNPTHIQRRFNLDREIPEETFVKLLTSILEAKVGKQVARIIQTRLGRKLQPFDIWYKGFNNSNAWDEQALDALVRAKYPDVNSFKKDLPNILTKLSFDKKTADYLAARIEVDPARGAGHAWGPSMRTESAHLRTRFPKNGMDYKGFNIAMHELGHNVEQVLSLNKVDNTLLEGVPNTAFTEGFAFVFQSRDLDVLGAPVDHRTAPQAQNQEHNKVLETFWSTREIAGVALVDIKVWHWMYDNPNATPQELKDAVIRIASAVWDQYYKPVLNVDSSAILAIYSHMISGSLYLPDYPLGYIIAFQVENYFKDKTLADEMQRMCSLGKITPLAWMENAISQPISSAPLIEAAQRAVAQLTKSE